MLYIAVSGNGEYWCRVPGALTEPHLWRRRPVVGGARLG